MPGPVQRMREGGKPRRWTGSAVDASPSASASAATASAATASAASCRRPGSNLTTGCEADARPGGWRSSRRCVAAHGALPARTVGGTPADSGARGGRRRRDDEIGDDAEWPLAQIPSTGSSPSSLARQDVDPARDLEADLAGQDAPVETSLARCYRAPGRWRRLRAHRPSWTRWAAGQTAAEWITKMQKGCPAGSA